MTSLLFPDAIRPRRVRAALWLLALVWTALLGGCARLPGPGVTPIVTASYGELRRELLARRPDAELFRLRGPFGVNVREDHALILPSGERHLADLYLSEHAEPAPLVILLHGYGNGKEDHAYQALHLATWGLHCLALQLPNTGPWIRNGRTLARIAEAIRRQPEIAGGRIDATRILLAGHSFGGSAVAVALAEGAPALGAILLDPATVGRDMPAFLRRIDKPVLLLGADEYVSAARGRDAFYHYIRGGFAEISIRGAAHEDAQFSLESAPQDASAAASAAEARQITFVSALTAAALSLAYTGGFDYAWASFGGGAEHGKFIEPRRK